VSSEASIVGDAFKKVKPGDPLAIPAATFNTFVDAARDFLARQHQQVQSSTPSGRHNCIVLVRNDSGADRQRFDVLGISGPVFNPSSDEDAFKNYPAMTGVTPVRQDHRGRFVILLEPVPAGKLARAVAAGVVPARLDVPDENYPYRLAEITDGSAANLKAASVGSATILWREGGTGIQWALVRLGNQTVSDESFWGRITASLADGANRWRYSFVEVEKTVPGYGGWSQKSGGHIGAVNARNSIEDMNSASGVQGNGVNVANLDTDRYTFTIRPCPSNCIVRMHEVRFGSTTEYWFAYANGVDGSCD
jgi:hypothetical protein